MKKKRTVKEQDSNKIWGIILDLMVAIIIVSALHLIVISVFNLSPRGLLREGIETSIYQQKMRILSYISVSYVIAIIVYFAFLRKYFSPAKKIFK